MDVGSGALSALLGWGNAKEDGVQSRGRLETYGGHSFRGVAVRVQCSKCKVEPRSMSQDTYQDPIRTHG